MIANKSNKAIVLIATIATLAVISVILMFFAQSSIFERQLTSNNNLERQAKLVATASIEWAASYIPKLAMGADDGDSSVNSKAYSSVADFYQFQVKKNENNKFERYDPHCPVEEYYLDSNNPYGKDTDNYKGNPSFYYERDPENRKGDEDISLPYEYSYRQNFDTNMVSLPTLHNPSDKLKDNTVSKGKPRWTVHSTLKCVDANAFWNINSPIKDTNADYKNMVTTLVSVVLGKNEAIIDKWSKEREKGEFADLGDFRERMSSLKGMKQKDLDKICRYITVDSWCNKKSFKYGKDYNHIDQDTDELWEKRYPININVASKEILTVVFQGITTKTGGISINENTAENLAERIVKDRKKYQNGVPFKTWNDVENYLYNKANLSKNVAEAIFAVIYPGMLPNKKSPNRAQYRKFDKSDIEVGTTECCLFSPGVFYCEAIGRVIEYNRKPYTVLAHSKVSVNMKLWEPYIVNSQSDFESQRDKSFNPDPEKVTAWTGIEGGITSLQDYNETYNNNVVVGYLQERQEEKEKEVEVDKDKPCRYWQWVKIDNSSKDEENKKEMRSDGLYLEDQTNYGVLDVTSSYTEWNEWDNTGFDLWIKPSYNPGDDQDAKVTLDNNNTLPIAMKVEKSTVDSCYILTRCAYDKGVDYDATHNKDKDQTYLTLSRTLCLKKRDQSGKNCEERDTTKYRVFYNQTIQSRVKEKLSRAGSSIYHALEDYLQDNFLTDDDQIISGDERSFRETYIYNMYNIIMEGKNIENEQQNEDFNIPFEFVILKLGSGIPDEETWCGEVKINIPKQSANGVIEKTKWDKVTLLSFHEKRTKCDKTIDTSFSSGFHRGELPSEFFVEGDDGRLFFYMSIFKTRKDCKRSDGENSKNWINPSIEDGEENIDGINSDLLYYGYISRDKNETKEAKEIVWFPGQGEETENTPIQTDYKYSRTECRIPIKLYKGRWYHIHARWEENKILIKEFDVSYKKMESKKQEDDSNTIPEDRTKIHTEQGFIRKNFIGGPGRLWVNKNEETSANHDIFIYPAESETNKIHYYCPNCVIYYSNYRNPSDNNMKRWRYGSPEKTESIYNGKFNLEDMHAEHNDPEYFYYGTVAWTQFAPENKNNGNPPDKEPNGAMFWVTINGDEKQFYSWGEEKKSSKDLENPNSIFLKKYDDIPKMPFKFDLHDNNNEGEDSASHLETTIVDRVVLYMIVQPQPIHWSYNTYKDKNLYQKQ